VKHSCNGTTPPPSATAKAVIVIEDNGTAATIIAEKVDTMETIAEDNNAMSEIEDNKAKPSNQHVSS